MPCGTTMTQAISFPEEIENKFFDYIGNRKRKEHKPASEVVQEFRQEYNEWIGNLPKQERTLVLGVGDSQIDEIFETLKEQIYYLNAKGLPQESSNSKKAMELLKKNTGRIDLIAIAAEEAEMAEHKKLIHMVRSSIDCPKKQTTILAIGNYEKLRAPYRALEIDAFIPFESIESTRNIIKAYLPFLA
jgi:hypothetical protein